MHPNVYKPPSEINELPEEIISGNSDINSPRVVTTNQPENM